MAEYAGKLKKALNAYGSYAILGTHWESMVRRVVHYLASLTVGVKVSTVKER